MLQKIGPYKIESPLVKIQKHGLNTLKNLVLKINILLCTLMYMVLLFEKNLYETIAFTTTANRYGYFIYLNKIESAHNSISFKPPIKPPIKQ